jgi:hypothetical protein
MVGLDDILWALLEIFSLWPTPGEKGKTPLWQRILGTLVLIAVVVGLLLMIFYTLGWF